MSAAVAALGHADRNSNPGRMLAHASARSRALLTFSSLCSCCPVSTFLGITAHARYKSHRCCQSTPAGQHLNAADQTGSPENLALLTGRHF